MGIHLKDRKTKKTNKMIYSKALVLSLISLMAAGRMLSKDNMMKKEDHFVHNLENDAVRKCTAIDWWVSC